MREQLPATERRLLEELEHAAPGWSHPIEVAHRAGVDSDEARLSWCALDVGGWIQFQAGQVAISPLGAERLGIRVGIVGGKFCWKRKNDFHEPRERPPRRLAEPAAVDQVLSREVGPAENAELAELLEHLRRQERLAFTNGACWPTHVACTWGVTWKELEPWLGNEACSACHGRWLRRDEYCASCNRSGSNSGRPRERLPRDGEQQIRYSAERDRFFRLQKHRKAERQRQAEYVTDDLVHHRRLAWLRAQALARRLADQAAQLEARLLAEGLIEPKSIEPGYTWRETEALLRDGQ